MIEPNPKGDVWLFAEQEDEHLSDTSLELCGKARQLADQLGVKVGAVLAGWNVRELSYRLIAHGVDKVYNVHDTRLEHYRTLPYARVMCQLISKHRPQIVMYGATPLGRDLAPRIASEMRAGLTADCTDLQIGDYTDPKTKSEYKNLLLQIRPAFGGNIIATIINFDRWPQMATVREGVMRMSEGDAGRKGQIIDEKIEFNDFEQALKVIEIHREERKVNLKAARIIVAGGGGVGSKDNFRLIHDLAGRWAARSARAERPLTAGSSARSTRSARPERRSAPPYTSPAASAARCSTGPAWRKAPRSSPSTGTRKRRSSAWRITGLSGI